MKLQTITKAAIVSRTILPTAAGSIRGSASGRALGLFDGRLKIIGGDEATEDRYPYAASLSDDVGHFCGGSLIARDVVLSAAHCDDQGSGNYKVTVGRHAHDDNDGQELTVKQAIPHPNYNFLTTDNDYLLIFLDEAASDSLETVKINADSDTPELSAAVTVMGWGDTDPTDDGFVLASELMEVEVNVISNEDCDDSNGDSGSYEDTITSNMLCAREEGGGEDSCQGDSGGPLIIKGSNASEDIQVGVVSFGIGCARQEYPGVYARISSKYEWIRSEVCGRSNYAPSEFDCSNAASLAPTTTSSPSSASNNDGMNDDLHAYPTWQPTQALDDDWSAHDDDWPIHDDYNNLFPTMHPTLHSEDDKWNDDDWNNDDWNDDNTIIPTWQPTIAPSSS